MNGINFNTFLSNTPFFNKSKEVDEKKTVFPGKNNRGDKKTVKDTQYPSDSVEITGESRQIKQAGYSRPKMHIKEEQETFKKLDAEGVQEGVELSDAAKDILAKLKEKYGDMDFYVASTSSDEEASYYMNQGTKTYSVLIDPETLESMAADEEVLAQYEEILDGTDELFHSIKEEIGEEDMGNVSAINITFDKNGNTSYLIELFENVMNHGKEEKKITRVKGNTQEELMERLREKIAKQKEELADKKESSHSEPI